MKRSYPFIIIAAACLLAYGNSVRNGLVGFDDAVLLDNARFSSSGELLLSRTGVSKVYEGGKWNPGVAYKVLLGRNLRVLSHSADYALFGQDLRLHHLSNVLYHVLAAVLAFLAAGRLIGPGGALAAALFFALHPVQSESVAYLAGRRDILLAIFYFLAFWFWARYREEKRHMLAWAAAGSWALALLSKESAVTLPLVVLAYEVYLVSREENLPAGLTGCFGTACKVVSRHRVAAALFLLAGAGLAAVVVYQQLNQKIITALGAYGKPLLWYGGSAGAHWATLPKILWQAVRVTVWPVNLLADYTYNYLPVAKSLFEPGMLAASAGLALAASFAWRLSRLSGVASFAVCWTVLTYLPHLPLVPSYHNQQVFAEHWLYLPLFGPALIFGWLVSAGAAKFGRRAYAAGAVLLVLLTARTVVRNADWRDAETLWGKTVLTAPACARAHCQLAAAHYAAGRIQPSLDEAEAAIRIDPGWFAAYSAQGQALAYLGRYQEAAAAFRRSVELNPRSGPVWASLAGVYMAQGRMDTAMGVFQEARSKGVKAPELANNLASLFLLTGRYSEAENALKESLRFIPYWAMTYSNLGALYLETGRFTEAAAELEKSLELDRAQPSALASLGLARGKLKLLEPALAGIDAAVKAGLSAGAAEIYRGIIYRDCGKLEASLASLERANRSAPSVETLSQLGQTLVAMGQPGPAEASYVAAIRAGNLPRDYYLLAMLYRSQGRVSEAGDALKEALGIMPSYGPALKLAAELK